MIGNLLFRGRVFIWYSLLLSIIFLVVSPYVLGLLKAFFFSSKASLTDFYNWTLISDEKKKFLNSYFIKNDIPIFRINSQRFIIEEFLASVSIDIVLFCFESAQSCFGYSKLQLKSLFGALSITEHAYCFNLILWCSIISLYCILSCFRHWYFFLCIYC